MELEKNRHVGKWDRREGPPKVDYVKKYSQFIFNNNTKAIQ